MFSQINLVHASPSHFLRSILILSSHLILRLTVGFLPSGVPSSSTLTEDFLPWLRFSPTLTEVFPYLDWGFLLSWLRIFYPDWGFPLPWMRFSPILTEDFLPWLRFSPTLTEVFSYLDWGFSTLTEVFPYPDWGFPLPWLRILYLDWGFSVPFPSVVRQMPGYNTQRRGTVSTLPS